MNRETPTVFVVDDDDSVRASLDRLLRSLGYTVRTFAEPRGFLESKRREGPGCLILDVELPSLNGLDVQKQLVELGSSMPIIFLSGTSDIPMSVQAMKAGAAEFLTKPFKQERLVEVVRAALVLDEALRRKRAELDELRRRYESLTPREREVMTGVVAGLLNKQIAGELGKTEATVKQQRAAVMTKMQARSLADLVRISSRLGIVTPDPLLPR